MIVNTQFPVALHSADHLHPRGAKQDNTHCPAFVDICEKLFEKPSLLDLGCAGGGLVKDFVDRGLAAVGLEGSDVPRTLGIGEWRAIPDSLFCCDITKPFTVERSYGGIKKFDIISAWEVLEHIDEKDLPQLFTNIRNHLKKGGIFCASIATFEDRCGDVVWHVTLKDREWWDKAFSNNGLVRIITHPFKESQFPRGSGNPLTLGDWSGSRFGFHFVAQAL